MENCGKPGGEENPTLARGIRACSACAGDYEDPDRTASDGEEEADAVEGIENDARMDFLRDDRVLCE